ncbi:putative peptidase YtmA [Insulibacter thermoxylanivorax]|uniref:Peptidase YtmA n=1 Tax=Insulibacter thermoxylanivorax TaxID=2749268 RepID=A0A916VGJ2_9BACL|nr:prolyl oligopeptidase family serine peptidase [Insulibacter thermoxylanivorax]GFR39038.1 putative peptidase YtmA [Insulibacter thermoxylanivorax]
MDLISTGRIDPSQILIAKKRVRSPGRGVQAYLITYRSQGLAVLGYYMRPSAPGTYPSLVYCRGGIGRVGMVTLSRILPAAYRGYAVFAPFYRGTRGCEGRDGFGGDDRHDVYAAIQLLRSFPEVSENKTVVVGFSRGSINAMQAARDCPEVGGAVIWCGVTDLLLTYEERIDLRRMLKRVVGHPVKDEQAYIERSPIRWIERVGVPVLILHSNQDENVSMRHAVSLAKVMEEKGRDHELIIYDGQPHRFSPEALEQAWDDIAAWAEQKVHNEG